MKVNQSTLFRLFKYSVYALLTLNIGLFFAEEWAAAAHRFAGGVGLRDVIEGFAATIDTATWVVLLLIFELETYVLDDRQFTPRVTLALQVIRAVCYAVIVYAFFGYLTKLLFLLQAAPLPGVSELCTLAGKGWVYAVDLDEYEPVLAGNCASLSAAPEFMRLTGISAVVDFEGFRDIVRLAWTDVINAGVWIGIVAMLEMDVQLQSRDLLQGGILRVSNLAKYVMYSILLLAAIYWGIKGDFVDFWDAFLWLVAFVFIEFNVLQWQEEDREARSGAAAGVA